jgi:hypothetical protein
LGGYCSVSPKQFLHGVQLILCVASISRLTADFYRAFVDKHRGPRELIKSRLCADFPVFSTAGGDTSGLFSTWAVAQGLAFSMKHGFWRYGLASRHYLALNVASNDEMDVLIAKVPRCAKRNLHCCG